MVRQSNGGNYRPGGRGGYRGRGRGGNIYSGRGRGVSKPPPLMARPMPPPLGIRRPPFPPHGPPPRMDFRRMDMRFPEPGMIRGMPNMGSRMPIGGPGPRGRGIGPLMGRNGMPPPGRGGLLPPPMPGPMGPSLGMFRPSPFMRGRGYPRGGRGGRNFRRGKRSGRGKGSKGKAAASPSGELNKPWVTEAIKNEILKKHKLHQKAKKARTKEDWEIFKEHRNKVTTMLREAKLEYIGAHPEEDVDKILAEAANTVSDKDSPTTASKLEEPMEEDGGGAIEGMDILIKSDDGLTTHTDPEVQMSSELK